jgi:beta-lactamase class D
MNKSIHLITGLIVITFVSSGYCEDSALAGLFKSKGVVGTIVISSLDGDSTYIYNDDRANERFVPGSTFKIPNTLIALEEGAVADEKENIKWDGKDKGLPAWNKDQSIETALPSSCVWFYQELAKRVGKEKYGTYLGKINYGNKLTGQDVTTFWLEGDLKISAVEQVTFLKKLYAKEFVFKQSSYELLRKLMIVEQTPSYTIRAKTGWVQRVNPQVGWFVGYVESGDKVWFFALNMVIANPADSRFRQELSLEALRLKGII